MATSTSRGKANLKRKAKSKENIFGGAIGWPFRACAKCSANWAQIKKRAKYWVNL